MQPNAHYEDPEFSWSSIWHRGPDGTLYVVSISSGSVYEIFRLKQK